MATLRLKHRIPLEEQEQEQHHHEHHQQHQQDRSEDQPELQQSSSMSSTSSFSHSPLDTSSDIGIREEDNTMDAHLISPSPSELELQQYNQAAWTQEEEQSFMAFSLPYIQGKRLSKKEMRLIRKEAKRMGMRSLHLVDQLLEHHNQQLEAMKKKQYQIPASTSCSDTDEDEPSTPPRYKYKSKCLEEIEDVDETDNIQAYFSRMASLKVGGHLPNLNTSAIESFVEADVSVIQDDVIEVDLDVGFVNRSLTVDYAPKYLMDLQQIESPSWDDMVERLRREDDCLSTVSTTLDDSRNRYEPLRSLRTDECEDEVSDCNTTVGHDDTGDQGSDVGSPPHGKDGKHVTWDEGVVIKSATPNRPRRRSAKGSQQGKGSPIKKQAVISVAIGCHMAPVVLSDDDDDDDDEEAESSSQGSSTTTSCVTETNVNRDAAVVSEDEGDWATEVQESDPYSFEQDLDIWIRKKNAALVEIRPVKPSILTKPCHSKDSAQDESACVELTLVNPTPAPSIKSVDAVKRLHMSTLQRCSRRRRWEKRRHIPDDVSATMQNMWRRPYGVRTKAHTGYIGVDQYSLLESTAVVGCTRPHPLDLVPWECRDVRQYFLQEHSISFSTNWFGRLRKTKGHDKVPYPVSRPKSMEMPTEQIPPYYDDDCGSSRGTHSCKTRDSSRSPVKIASLSATTSEGEPDDGDSLLRPGSADHSASKAKSKDTRVNESPKIAPFYAELERKMTDKDDEDMFPGVDYGSFSSHSFSFGSEDSSPVPTASNSFAENDRDTSLFCGALEGDGASGFLDNDTSMFAWSNVLSRSDAPGQSFDKYACSEENSGSSSYSGSSCSDDESETHDESSTGSYEDIPECGVLINVKPKLGERVSRVHPNYTSHLLRSRFRKKFFPRGSFPFDNNK